jgi:hypothetical protein
VVLEVPDMNQKPFALKPHRAGPTSIPKAGGYDVQMMVEEPVHPVEVVVWLVTTP